MLSKISGYARILAVLRTKVEPGMFGVGIGELLVIALIAFLR